MDQEKIGKFISKLRKDNKYLFEFLSSIGVDLTKCAEPDYIN